MIQGIIDIRLEKIHELENYLRIYSIVSYFKKLYSYST